MQTNIPLNVHNVLDYVVGGTLISAPFLFRFSDVRAARNLHIGVGSGLIGYSLITNYKYSLAKILPLGVHMTMDAISGATLMAAPRLLGYRHRINKFQSALHLIFGLGAIGLVALTKPRTEQGKLMVDQDLRTNNQKNLVQVAA